MKLIQPFIYLLTFALLMGCQDQTLHADLNLNEELDEMSIYHLPSEWHTQNGDLIALENLRGTPLVAVMIYTACKTACPRLVADMRHIETAVSSKVKKDVKYLMISIDPTNDTPDKLMQFAKDNQMTEDKWLFLQGTEESVRDFANILAVKYKQISPIDFSHSNIISVFNANGVLQYQKEGLGMENDEIIDKIITISK